MRGTGVLLMYQLMFGRGSDPNEEQLRYNCSLSLDLVSKMFFSRICQTRSWPLPPRRVEDSLFSPVALNLIRSCLCVKLILIWILLPRIQFLSFRTNLPYSYQCLEVHFATALWLISPRAVMIFKICVCLKFGYRNTWNKVQL